MERISRAQLAFDEDPDHNWTAPEPAGEPPELERKLRPPRIITFSKIEKIIYEQNDVEPSGPINASLAIGSAIDDFLVPAEFIYRERADYCFPPELYPEWNLQNVFSRYYPTGYRREKYLELLEYFRKDFTKKNPLRPGNSQLERGLIKERLIPLWNEVARGFKLDSLALQHVMDSDGNYLLPLGRRASEETVMHIAQRIVVERFDRLVEDDPNYTYFAKPDCLLTYIIDGCEYSILVQPDYVKKLDDKKKSVKQRIKKGEIPGHKRVVTKRILGDLKDSTARDFSDPSTAYGKAMRVYSRFLKQIGQWIKFGPKDIQWLKFPDYRVKRAFIIPHDVEPRVPAESVETRLDFMREDGKNMSVPMPTLNHQDEKLARSILEEALLASQKSKLQ